MPTTIDPAYFIYAAMLVSLVLVRINRRVMSPVLSIINRWLRWGIFATGGAYIYTWLEISDHRFGLLVVFFALLWFLGETLYNWAAIKALSESTMPLFPKYAVSETGEAWPTHARFSKLRDTLRAHGFTHTQSLRAEIATGTHIRVSVYQDAAATSRLQITFLPYASGALSTCMSLSSQTASGHNYETDNVFLPYAGFYPENVLVERRPWIRSLKRLLSLHKTRLEIDREHAMPWATEPLFDINEHQRKLEQLNTELGFLTPHADREEFGKVTSAGRYRIWKEIWTLNYLGRSARYV